MRECELQLDIRMPLCYIPPILSLVGPAIQVSGPLLIQIVSTPGMFCILALVLRRYVSHETMEETGRIR